MIVITSNGSHINFLKVQNMDFIAQLYLTSTKKVKEIHPLGSKLSIPGDRRMQAQHVIVTQISMKPLGAIIFIF